MKLFAIFLILLITAVEAFAQLPAVQADTTPSPAERSAVAASKLLERDPRNFEAYNAMALALLRRARETDDRHFYAQAEETLAKSLAISPSNLGAEKVRVWLLLAKHEFAPARDKALQLSKRVPDDVMAYGFLSDANAELGNYKEAEDATQMMLDLRPGNVAGLTRAANLRGLYGDIDGALDLLTLAYQSTPSTQFEDAASITVQMAHVNLSAGRIVAAGALLQKALKLVPDYPYALTELAHCRIEQKRYDEAVELLQRRYAASPRTEILYDLAEALERGGRSEEAAKAFGDFERKAASEINLSDNSNSKLIFYYADHAKQPTKALELALLESARRHDVFTLDCYAWALHVNHRDKEAQKVTETELAVGIRNAKMYRHAREIALANGDRVAADHYLQQALMLDATGSEQAKVPAGASAGRATEQ